MGSFLKYVFIPDKSIVRIRPDKRLNIQHKDRGGNKKAQRQKCMQTNEFCKLMLNPDEFKEQTHSIQI